MIPHSSNDRDRPTKAELDFQGPRCPAWEQRLHKSTALRRAYDDGSGSGLRENQVRPTLTVRPRI